MPIVVSFFLGTASTVLCRRFCTAKEFICGLAWFDTLEKGDYCGVLFMYVQPGVFVKTGICMAECEQEMGSREAPKLFPCWEIKK